MQFKKYQHLERFGTPEVEGINIGKCYIFPKLDGTNGQIYLNDKGEIEAASRNRVLSHESDNAGFFNNEVKNNPKYIEYFKKYPTHRLIGEWLVPHTLKTYRDDAWRKFYVFDVMDGDKYINCLDYQPILHKYNIEYIPEIAFAINPSEKQLYKFLELNTHFIKDGCGTGEGIVIKNYDFVNSFGRKVWAKIVSSEFKEKHIKEMGAPTIIGEETPEIKFVNEYLTEAFISKTLSKLMVANPDKTPTQLLGNLIAASIKDLISEETYNFIHQHKVSTINFKTLNGQIASKVRKLILEGKI